jgi:hypothetical protein
MGTELSYTVKSKGEYLQFAFIGCYEMPQTDGVASGNVNDIGRIIGMRMPHHPVVGQPLDIEFGYANSVTIDVNHGTRTRYLIVRADQSRLVF